MSLRLLCSEQVRLASKLEAESAVRLVETYDAAESEYMDLRLPFQSPAQFKRSVLVSYLDEEMLVVRDSLGRPDVLMRIDEPASSSTWAPPRSAATTPTTRTRPRRLVSFGAWRRKGRPRPRPRGREETRERGRQIEVAKARDCRSRQAEWTSLSARNAAAPKALERVRSRVSSDRSLIALSLPLPMFRDRERAERAVDRGALVRQHTRVWWGDVVMNFL